MAKKSTTKKTGETGKKYDRQHLRNIDSIQNEIKKEFEDAVKTAARLGATISEADLSPDTAFSFSSHPTISKRADKLLSGLETGLSTAIVNGIRSAWTLANNKNDEISRQVFGDNVGKLSKAQYNRYFSTNGTALDAFLERKTNGLSLSERVWRYTQGFKDEIEMGLEVGIRNGLSADEMSRDLRQWLQNPDMLFRRIRDEYGDLQLSKRAAAYHPGQGVYRLSYMNARRLAATETNIAYHTADYERWQELDFVVGIHVILSGNHTCLGSDGKAHPFEDICDELSGKDENDTRGRYPKDFKFTGWHPHCRCTAISILKTDEEIAADTQRILNGEEVSTESVNSVDDVPQRFNDWVSDNKERAKGWSSMPYFIRQNPQYIQGFEVGTYTKAERKFTRARCTNEAMQESLGIFLQKKYPELPNTEKAAIFHYTQGDGATFRQLNNQLRRGNLTEFNEAFSDLLSKGLSKLETTTEPVYRTMRLNRTGFNSFVQFANNKSSKIFEGFTSSSLDRKTATDFTGNKREPRKNESDVLLIIQGKSGHPIEGLSQFSGRFTGKPNQREVLFDKGCKFRFDEVKKENGIYVFYLTEI